MTLLLDRFTSIEGRLTQQDTVLAEIRSEVKTTNGRVTIIETERIAEQKQRRELREDREDRRGLWRDRVNLVAIFGSAFLAGTAGYIGHALHLW